MGTCGTFTCCYTRFLGPTFVTNPDISISINIGYTHPDEQCEIRGMQVKFVHYLAPSWMQVVLVTAGSNTNIEAQINTQTNLCDEHGPHTALPHFLQWCRRLLIVVNVSQQFIHAGTAESGVQIGAKTPVTWISNKIRRLRSKLAFLLRRLFSALYLCSSHNLNL